MKPRIMLRKKWANMTRKSPRIQFPLRLALWWTGSQLRGGCRKPRRGGGRCHQPAAGPRQLPQGTWGCWGLTREFCVPDGGAWSWGLWVKRVMTGLMPDCPAGLKVSWGQDLCLACSQLYSHQWPQDSDGWPLISTVCVEWMNEWVNAKQQWLLSSFPSQLPWRTPRNQLFQGLIFRIHLGYKTKLQKIILCGYSTFFLDASHTFCYSCLPQKIPLLVVAFFMFISLSLSFHSCKLGANTQLAVAIRMEWLNPWETVH